MLRFFIRIFAGSFFLVLLVCTDSNAQAYTRNEEMSSVRLSYAELMAIIGRTREMIKNSNAAYAPKYITPTEYLDVGNGHQTVELTTEFSVAQLSTAPQTASSVHYVYRFPDAPISSVQLNLADYRRDVAVGGQSRVDVDALSNLIVNDLNEHTLMFAGPGFRLAATTTLSLVALSLLIFGLAIESPKYARIVLACLSISFFAFLFLPPWSEWLSGAAVYAGDSSFLTRNGPLFTFVGLLISLLGICAGVIRWLLIQFRYSTQVEKDSLEKRRNDTAYLM